MPQCRDWLMIRRYLDERDGGRSFALMLANVFGLVAGLMLVT
jgi:hypothetical protein